MTRYFPVKLTDKQEFMKNKIQNLFLMKDYSTCLINLIQKEDSVIAPTPQGIYSKNLINNSIMARAIYMNIKIATLLNTFKNTRFNHV